MLADLERTANEGSEVVAKALAVCMYVEACINGDRWKDL